MATPTVPMVPPTEVSPATGAEHRSASGDRPPGPASTSRVNRHRLGIPALFLLRLALGVEFLWAFFDKLFGLGYSTPSARAWLNGDRRRKGSLPACPAARCKASSTASRERRGQTTCS